MRACGAPFAGRYRFPAVAWRVGVHISDVSMVPSGEGVVFRSRLTARGPRQPDVPVGYAELARAGSWEIHAVCRGEAR